MSDHIGEVQSLVPWVRMGTDSQNISEIVNMIFQQLLTSVIKYARIFSF